MTAKPLSPAQVTLTWASMMRTGAPRAAALADAAHDAGAGGVHGGEEVVAVEAPVPRQQHVGAEVRKQPGGVVGLAFPGGPEDRGDHRPGSGLDQRHQIESGIAAVRTSAQPAPVAFGVGGLDGAAAVEGDVR
ncbi:hypothetical protein QMZ92_33975 [Streptomyces sp. HNM0645]|uniref:hypothetical protein n=1 Tax=Streptomyces sp. HNM0645 TaxID=2782343 RepID=UPI0024B7D336|nr:hypothetical protein [Streptomyces sp. HNM0645]MDI9889207.1 hypothetical protein [Streptomyces sp. HNM0645]